MNCELLKLRCLSEDTRKALILEDEMEVNFQKRLQKCEAILMQWEVESKSFEEMGRKLFSYFQDIAPSEKLILPQEAPVNEKTCNSEDKENTPRGPEKVAMSFGAQTSFFLTTDCSVSTEYRASLTCSASSTLTTPMPASFSTATTPSDVSRTLNTTSQSTFGSTSIACKTLPFDNLISPSVIETPIGSRKSDVSEEYTSVFDNLTTPSVLESPEINDREKSTDESPTASEDTAKSSDVIVESIENAGADTTASENPQLVGYDITSNAPLVGYDMTVEIKTEPLVSYDITVRDLTKTDSIVSENASQLSKTDVTFSNERMEKIGDDTSDQKLVDYDVTNPNLVDYDMTTLTTQIVSDDTPVQSDSVFVDTPEMKDTPCIGGLVDYDQTTFIKTPRPPTSGETSSQDPSAKNIGLVDYDQTGSKTFLVVHNSVPGGALVNYDAAVGNISHLPSSTCLSTNTPSVSKSLVSDGTPSMISDTPFHAKSSLVKSQLEDISSLKRSLASSIDELSAFENPNDTGINREDVRKVYEDHLDGELDYMNHNDTASDVYHLRNRNKQISLAMSKHQSSNKQSSNLTKDTSNSAISVATVGDFVEMTSIATSPLHVDEKSDRSTESTNNKSIDFNVHSFKEDSVLVVPSPGRVSPQKRANGADSPQKALCISEKNELSLKETLSSTINRSDAPLTDCHNTSASPSKKSKIEVDEEEIRAFKRTIKEKAVSFAASPVERGRQSAAKKPKKRKTRKKRQLLTMPKKNKKLADSKYTFTCYTKVRAYQNSPSNRALRQLQQTTTTLLMSSAKKKKSKNITKSRKKSAHSIFELNKSSAKIPTPTSQPLNETPNGTTECSVCTVELNSPPPSQEGCTPLTKILCQNCICALNAREGTFLNTTTAIKKSELPLFTTLLGSQTISKGTSPSKPSPSKQQTRKRRGKLSQELNNPSSAPTDQSLPLATRMSLRKREPVKNKNSLKSPSFSRALRTNKKTATVLPTKDSSPTDEQATGAAKKTEQKPKTKANRAKSSSPTDAQATGAAKKTEQKPKTKANRAKSSSPTDAQATGSTKKNEQKPKAKANRGRTRKNLKVASDTKSTGDVIKSPTQAKSESLPEAEAVPPPAKKRGKATTKNKSAPPSPASPLPPKKSRAGSNASGAKPVQFHQQLSVLKEDNEEQQSLSNDKLLQDVNSRNNKKQTRTRKNNTKVDVPSQAQQSRRPGLRKRKIDPSLAGDSLQNAEKANNSKQNNKPTSGKQTQRVSEKKPKPSKSETTANENVVSTDESSHKNASNKSIEPKPDTVQTERQIKNSSSSSDDNEVILNLPEEFKDYNSKERRKARKANNNSGMSSQNSKENRNAIMTKNVSTSSEISDMENTVIRNNERTPQNRALRSLQPRVNNKRVRISDMPVAKPGDPGLPQPFARVQNKDNRLFQKPLRPVSTTNQANDNRDQGKQPLVNKNPVGLDGTQSSNNSTMMNRSRKLFKTKNNSVRTPDSGDKRLPMNSTMLDHHHLQGLNSGTRGNVIPDLSVIQNASRAVTSRFASFKYSQQNVSLGCPPAITSLANRIQQKK